MSHYENQVDGIIDIITKNPWISRSDLIDVKVNWFRIANVTSTITLARKKLREAGKTIVCKELPPILNWRKRGIRRTTYYVEEIAAYAAEPIQLTML